jgi:hypothetical protein
LEAILRGLRYGLIGLAASCALPWLFVQIGLADRQTEE